MKAWKRIEPTTVHKQGYRTVVSKTFIQNDGSKGVWEVFLPDGQQFACVIALTTEGNVLIARQFRPGPEKIMEELPGGFVDKGERPKNTAERELLEETGYRPQTIEYLGAHHKDAYMNGTWHYYLATGCTKQTTEQIMDEGEEVEIDQISIAELIDNARNDKMTDAVAVFWAYETLKTLEENFHAAK